VVAVVVVAASDQGERDGREMFQLKP